MKNTPDDSSFRTLLDMSPDGVIVVNSEDGSTRYVNPAAKQMLGFSGKESDGIVFGFPLGDVGAPVEVDLLRDQGAASTVELRMSDLDWDGVQSRLVLLHDVTARKALEAHLRSSNQLVQTALDALASSIAVLDEKGCIVLINEAWRRFALAEGFPDPDRFLGVNYLDVCDMAPLDQYPEAWALGTAIREILEGQRDGFTIEYACNTPRENHWFTAHARRCKTGSLGRVVVTHEDVTTLKQAKELLAAEKEILEGIAVGDPIDHVLTDLMLAVGQQLKGAHSAILLLDQHCRHLQFVAAPNVPESYKRAVDPLDLGSTPGAAGTAVARGTAILSVDIAHDPVWKPHRAAALEAGIRAAWSRPIRVGGGEIIGVFEIYHAEPRSPLPSELRVIEWAERMIDIAVERTREREALAASEERFRRIVEASGEGIWVAGIQGNIQYANRQLAEMLGCSVDDMLGRNFLEFVDPQDRAQLELHIGTGKLANVGRRDVKFRRTDGAELWAIVSTALLHSDTDEFLGVLRTITDITDRKRAEDELRRSQQRLELAFDTAQIGMWEWDLVSHRREWTPSLERIHGLAPGEFDGKRETFWNLILPEDRSAVIDAEEGATTYGKDYTVEYRIALADGDVRWIERRGKAERDDLGRPVRFVGTGMDVTERRVLEQQFYQSQKMEAIGRLAGGVAHDFNNLLTVINGYTDLTLRRLHEDDPLRSHLGEVHKAAVSASSLTRQLLAFSRRQIFELKVVDMNATVSNMQKMLGRLIGEDLELATSLAEDLWNVRTDPAQIEQVLVNLAVNARDAMPDGGLLTIETANVVLDSDYTALHVGVSPGPYVRVTLTDTGVGMDAATQTRIFEPFFTTKTVGKGTGLGLSMVYGIVKQSGGYISVYSEVGVGTAFKIYLPALQDAQVDADSRQTDAPQKISGNETILLVEDEDAVRTLARMSLRQYGYVVLEARNGGEALLLVESYTEKIDLLVTDVVMPRMSGAQLAERLREVKPELAVVFMSGYTEDAIVHHGILNEGIDFIPKPFTPDLLVRRIREVLDRNRT